jgi:CheY-like chemotaxis protein
MLAGDGLDGWMSWNVLIIEDDEDIAESLADVLGARGYHVAVAANGKDAIERIRATAIRPDVILLDLLMPVMDGIGFLEARAAEPLLATVPVIIITAQPGARAKVAEPVYASIAKPLPLSELLETVNHAIHGLPPGGSRGKRARRAA